MNRPKITVTKDTAYERTALPKSVLLIQFHILTSKISITQDYAEISTTSHPVSDEQASA